MKAILTRNPRHSVTDDPRIGDFVVYTGSGEKVLELKCLELPWKLNKNSISSIPYGTYQVSPRTSSRFGQHYILKDVPGRTYILIHAGNTKKDTYGCILVGMTHGSLGGEGAVLQSRVAMKSLEEALVGHDKGSSFTLEITWAS